MGTCSCLRQTGSRRRGPTTVHGDYVASFLSPPPLWSQSQCGGLYQDIPHNVRHLNTWSSWWSCLRRSGRHGFVGGCLSLGSTLESKKPQLHLACSLCFTIKFEDVSSAFCSFCHYCYLLLCLLLWWTLTPLEPHVQTTPSFHNLILALVFYHRNGKVNTYTSSVQTLIMEEPSPPSSDVRI